MQKLTSEDLTFITRRLEELDRELVKIVPRDETFNDGVYVYAYSRREGRYCSWAYFEPKSGFVWGHYGLTEKDVRDA